MLTPALARTNVSSDGSRGRIPDASWRLKYDGTWSLEIGLNRVSASLSRAGLTWTRRQESSITAIGSADAPSTVWIRSQLLESGRRSSMQRWSPAPNDRAPCLLTSRAHRLELRANGPGSSVRVQGLRR
jgi:hypothetical protein